MKPSDIIVFFIIFSIIIVVAFLISLILVRKIEKRKLLLILYLPFVIITISFFLFAYSPRGINKKYLKDNPIRIYCCYKDIVIHENVSIQMNENKNSEMIEKSKKIVYIPTYNIMKYKISYAVSDYFCIQYDEYYIIIGENLWLVNEGTFDEYKIFNADYKLIQNKSGISEKMKNFDFNEWKNFFYNGN